MEKRLKITCILLLICSCFVGIIHNTQVNAESELHTLSQTKFVREYLRYENPPRAVWRDIGGYAGYLYYRQLEPDGSYLYSGVLRKHPNPPYYVPLKMNDVINE